MGAEAGFRKDVLLIGPGMLALVAHKLRVSD